MRLGADAAVGQGHQESEILERGPWCQLRANEKFHSVEENTSARERCKQLLVGGVAAVDWVELCGQK